MKYYQKAVYKSPTWKRIREAVIQRDRDICYFCGKMILKKRTIHHLQEIDENNYSDENIAFNLDNLVECHKECHDKHHDRFKYFKKSIVDDDLNIDYQRRKEKDESKNTLYKV